MEEQSSVGAVPEWVVTFGDMMSLLLTFFIMLVSFSEMKSEEKYQMLMDSLHQQFGYHESRASLLPGNFRPRNSSLAKLASTGRAKRLDVMQGGAKVQAPVGDNEKVNMIRPGKKTGIGTVLYFQEDQIELNDDQRSVLRAQAEQLQGKPQKVEVRGHTSVRPIEAHGKFRDNWDVSFERCRQVVQYLVEDLKLDSRRFRISAAGANEPLSAGTDPAKLAKNPRVEVYLLDEVVRETLGTEDEQNARFVPEKQPANAGEATPPGNP